MADVIACPKEHELQQLLNGEAAPAAVDAFAEHLERCGRCAEAVERLLAGDTLLEAMKAQTTAEASERPGVQALIERFLRLHPADPPSVPATFSTTLGEHHDEAGKGAPPAAVAERPDFLAPPQGPGEIGRLGPYRVLKVLGTGGMGIVFQAEDVHLKRTVALKVLKPEAAGKPAARERFLREAQAAAREHENVVTIYQVGEEHGVPFLAMQWLKGLSLEDQLQRTGALSVPGVLRLGRQIALGLAAAHEHGLIHRDVKPANLWLEASPGCQEQMVAFPFRECLVKPVEAFVLANKIFQVFEQTWVLDGHIC